MYVEAPANFIFPPASLDSLGPLGPPSRAWGRLFPPFPCQIVYAGLPDAEGREHILRAAKARMEGLGTTGGTTSASARVSAADDKNKLRPATLLGERASNVSAAAPNDASAGAAAAAAPAPDENVRKTTQSQADTSSAAGGGRWARDVDVAWLSQQTKGYSGADLSSLVRNAAMVALREEGERAAGGTAMRAASAVGGSVSVARNGVLVLERRHFEAALSRTEPSSGPEAVAKHERWARQWHVAS